LKFPLATFAVLLSAALASTAQQPGPPKAAAFISFHFERPGLDVPKFTLTVNEDGTGRYAAEQVLANPGLADDGAATAMQHIDRTFVLSQRTTREIFAAARELDHFNAPCASKAKNVADTGRKTLHYMGDGVEGSCMYNYSQDKRVVMLTDTFGAIAATLDIGRKLDFDHRFDRLGLDAITAQLVEEVNAGHAIELGTIAPTLRSLAQDSDVMERVRSRAAKLMLQASSTY
jgi:hypothetical protein